MEKHDAGAGHAIPCVREPTLDEERARIERTVDASLALQRRYRAGELPALGGRPAIVRSAS